MELTVTGDLAKQILTASKKDSKLAEALARQYLTSVEPQAMAAFLLTQEVATSLLAARLRKNPIATIQSLQRLPARTARTTRPKKAGPRRATRKAVVRPRQGRRRRLSTAEVEQLKSQVKSFLVGQRWATRKQLTESIALDTQAIYRRIMTELQQEGVIVSKGEKSKAVYALKAGRRGVKAGSGKKRGAKKPGRKSNQPA